ncbi:disease resistance protein At4g27190-like [Magnolia sinica]|uniref:disease resistance protein At4g27190-like n=1 Tax=Magnolia sinica TaxID=86752 RepID=UPI002658496C|nr:disease resistance protein At4g27190-like [Magnolia sinica]
MAVEIVGIVWQIGKDVLKLVKDPVDYLFHYERNVVNFKAEVESLTIIRNDVQVRVDGARRRRDRIDGDLEAWLTSVQQVEANATRLENGVRGSVGCFNGWHPNCCSHYKLGKEAKETMNSVKQLQERGRIFCQNLQYDVPPPSINSMLASGDYLAFTSREATIEKIMKALEDEAIRTIGVFGMGGIGKTTLMKEIGKQVKNTGLYNDVVMVEVTHNPDLTRIRKEIAGQLGMELKTYSDVVNKGALLERLQDTKTLVILDNVWQELDLVEIGVPFGDNRKSCKIMLTTRNLDVCNRNVSEVEIEVGFLSEAESWNLFRKVIRGAVDSSILDGYGKDIVNECGNLPLLIAAVGTALRHKEKIVWSDALTKLRKGTLIETEHKKVFSCLELSYEHLENDEIKSCFLFCCLFPEGSDIEIETLLRYGFSEELLFDDAETLKEGRERVYSTIDKLKACCLLLNGSQEGYVKMHDCVRDVAKSIASKPGNGFLIKAGVKIQDWPRKEKLNECKRISLMKNEITMLDVEPDCPNLLTLLLQNDYLLKKISDSFFQGMKSLVVLDLSCTCISSFPCVTTLRALFLSKCLFLTDLSQLGEMEKLEILCLSKTNIKELPEEMGRLSHLKLLDLTDTASLKRIPPKVISKLRCLEELYMENSFSEWEIEGKGDGSNARLAELESLNRLTTLYIHVRNTECLSQEISISWTDISRLCISVANKESMFISTRTMRLDISKPVSHWVKVLMERSEQLELVRSEFCEVERWEEMFDDGLPPALKDLKLLKVYNDWGESFLLACLLHCQKIEELEIEGCQKMKKIVPDKDGDSLHPVKALQPFIFENLQFLVVRHCIGFKNLLSWRLAPALKQLKGLMVDGCNEMEVIIANEGAVDTTVLPCLQDLYLSELPKLRSFCEGEALLELPSLFHISVTRCFGLKKLPLGANSGLSIADMTGESEWFEALEWADEIAKSRFHDLFYRPDNQRLNMQFMCIIGIRDDCKR